MSFTMTYDERNRTNLDKLAPNTKKAAYAFYQYCLDKKVDILIYETIRTVEQQRKNVANEKSETMRSYHLVGQALDFVPVKGKQTLWNGYKDKKVQGAIAYAKSIGFEWGGDWKSLVDCPHLQFNYKGYGTDKNLDEKAQTRDGKLYRVQTGTWTKTPEGIADVAKAEKIFTDKYAKFVYRVDEGGHYRLLTGTYADYATAQRIAKEIQSKHGILCYPVEA